MHRVHTSASVGERKFAEKLTILVDRGQGILTRVYNIKKTCGDSSTRPSCLGEKSLESATKFIVKKFPNIVMDKNHLTAISGFQKDILSTLSTYYYTFVDVMEFKDITNEVITSLATSQFFFDITVNYDLTKSVLDLVSMYASMLILLGSVEERRAIAGLYNVAHEATRGAMDTSFPRLAQMLIDYDNPIKKMTEEFIPLSKVILQAVMSLFKIYNSRNLTADQLRKQNVLSISNTPQTMLQPTISGELPCEFMSLETMHRWILFSFLLCYSQLNTPGASDLWKLTLQDGYTLTLFRDESLLIHSVFEKVLQDSRTKEDRKRSSESTDALSHALQNAGPLHRERRRYLRTALSELISLISDSPGLLGPKAVTILSALTLARDEVFWLFKHNSVSAPKSKNRPNPEDYNDNALPELIFLIVQLKDLMRKHHHLIVNYYLKYMAGFDAQLIRHVVMQIQVCPEEESLLTTSFANTLALLQGKDTTNMEFDFQALRLDWFRLQALGSVNKAALSLRDVENSSLAPAMNGIVVHSKLVDHFEELLIDQADMSFLCFFYRQFEGEFNRTMKTPSMLRYVISFPMVSGEFLNATSPFCPEERINIGERCVSCVNHFLEMIAKEVKRLLGILSTERMNLDDQLLPHRASAYYLQSHSKNIKQKGNKQPPPPVIPGSESTRRMRENTVKQDSHLEYLVAICFSVNCFPSVSAWDHTFSPREYLVSHLEDLFMKHVVSMLNYNPDTYEIARPSVVLSRIHSYMASLRTLELYVNIDMTRVLTAVLLQETQQLDSKGESTITSIYTSWYTNTLLKRVASGQVCYSKSRKCFVSKKSLAFKAEEYTDLTELKALAEVIGPYGIRFFGERLMDQVSGQVKEIKKLVINNQDTLLALHTNRDKPEIFMEVLRKLKNSEDLIARTTIVGIIMAFRKLTLEALNSVLENRIPFLLSSVTDFKKNIPDKSSNVADQMAIAGGIPCDVDPLLYNIIKAQNHCDKSREDYTIWSLYLVFVGVTLPRELAFKTDTTYLPFFEGHENNAHCLPIAVNALAGAIFALYGETQQRERMKEFLVFISSRIMILAKETEKEKDTPKSRESVYLLLDLFVEESPFLTRDLLESCFPYALLRDAYNSVYRKPAVTGRKVRDTETPF